MNQEVKRMAIELRREQSIKLPDAIVASTALLYNIPLITADKDFKKIEGIDLLLVSI